MDLPDGILPHLGGNPETLFSQVAERIASAIVSGAVPPGALIPDESVLGTHVPVSRSVYREAVKFLAGKGLIESRPRSGTRASPVSSWNLLDPDVLRWQLRAGGNEKFINDLYELRAFIEPNVARLAAERRTPQQAEALMRAYEGMASTPPMTPENTRFDLAFHETLIDSCGNQALMCLRSMVMTTLMWALGLQHGKTAQDYAAALADHKRVAEAVARKDGATASAIMIVLVNDALHETLEMFRRARERHKLATAAE
ncbi:MAG: FadR family transcriptional regulator [Proteobacteria bacterium]|nr:FadR family transcriptional regulator [Pseudomonadota bacterium]